MLCIVGKLSAHTKLEAHITLQYVQCPSHINKKCKNIFTKMLKDVGIEVPKSIETSAACMQTKTGNDSMQQS